MEELTAQITLYREKERNQSLLEEELSTLAATLGRLQLEKNHIEKEYASQKNQLDTVQDTLKNHRVTGFTVDLVIFFVIDN